jgi:FAD binding domain
MRSVIQALVEALGDQIRVGADVPLRNHADASGLEPTPPQALILSRSTTNVATALRICHEHQQPVVTQGGLTGLAGGAYPPAGEIALSLERMSGIEEVDPASATLTALAGTPLAAVQQAADEAAFLCGIDLGASGTCTIGGRTQPSRAPDHGNVACEAVDVGTRRLQILVQERAPAWRVIAAAATHLALRAVLNRNSAGLVFATSPLDSHVNHFLGIVSQGEAGKFTTVLDHDPGLVRVNDGELGDLNHQSGLPAHILRSPYLAA